MLTVVVEKIMKRGMRKDGYLQMRFRLVSWLILYLPFLVVGAGALLAKSWMVHDDRFEVVGIVVAASAVITFLVILVQAARISCPVCFGRVFGSAGCSKHREAKRVLGSTRLGTVVQTVLAIEDVKCRFCGTHLRLHLDDFQRPVRNEIDEFHALQLRNGCRAQRSARPMAGSTPVLKGPARMRKRRVPVAR